MQILYVIVQYSTTEIEEFISTFEARMVQSSDHEDTWIVHCPDNYHLQSELDKRVRYPTTAFGTPFPSSTDKHQ